MFTSEQLWYAVVLAITAAGVGWAIGQWFILRKLIKRRRSLTARLEEVARELKPRRLP